MFKINCLHDVGSQIVRSTFKAIAKCCYESHNIAGSLGGEISQTMLEGASPNVVTSCCWIDVRSLWQY